MFRFGPIAGAIVMVLASILFSSLTVGDAKAAATCPAHSVYGDTLVGTPRPASNPATCITNGHVSEGGFQITNYLNTSNQAVVLRHYVNSVFTSSNPSCSGSGCGIIYNNGINGTTLYCSAPVNGGACNIGYSYADANGQTSSFSFNIADGSSTISSFSVSGGGFDADVVAPVISEVRPIASPSPYIANYQMNSSEAGTFTYGGDCSSSDTTANVGLNSLNFNALSHGTHSNCTITVTDASGNISDTLDVTSFAVDTVKPTAAITTDSGGSFNQSTLTPFTATVTFTEGVRSFLSTELVATNATVSAFTSGANGDAVYTVTITPNGDGNVTLNVHSNVAFDYVNNYSNGAPQVTVTQIDDVGPVISEVNAISSPSNKNQSYNVHTNEDGLFGFGGDCYSPDTNARVGRNLIGFYNMSHGLHSNCTITVTDAQNNVSNILIVTPFTVDAIKPDVAITTNSGGSFNENAPGTFTATVTFTEPVSTYANGELTATNATVSNFTSGADGDAVYTAIITPNGHGNVALNVATYTAYDSAFNHNNAAPQVTVTQIDDVAPTVVITTNSGGAFNESTLSSFIATITFNEAVTDFVDGELTASNATVTNLSGSGTTYTATITPDGKGAIALNVGANVAQDTSNNNNTAAPQITVMQTDDVAPTATITGVPAIAGPNRGFTITLTFSEAVTGLLPSDIGATNAVVNNLSPVSGNGTVFTATVTPDGFGNVTVSLPTGMAQDSGSNGNVAVAGQTVTLDNTKPTVTISNTPPSHDGTTTFNATFQFSEQLDKGSFEERDITLTNATVSNLSTSDGITFTADITPLSSLDVIINVAANVAQDMVGNGNTAATQVSITGDRVSPNVAILNAPEKHDRVTPFNVTVEFNEDVFGFVAGGISTTNATVSNFVTVDDNTFTADITPTGPRDITLDIVVGAAKDFAGNDNTAAAQVTVKGTAIEDTKRIISNLLINRAGHLLNNQPNINALANGQFNSGGGDFGNLQINGNENGVKFSFSTSRSKVLSALNNNSQAYKANRIGSAFGNPTNQQTLSGHALSFTSTEDDNLHKPMTANAVDEIDALDQGIEDENGSNSRAGKFDVWTQIYGSQTNAGDIESSLWVGYFGAHYFTDENTLLGVVGQIDWASETNSKDASKASGRGWMVGPYFAGQVPDQNLFYEARASWGKSNNEVSPYGTYSDSFETTRWLTSAKVSGSYKLNDITLSPTASISYFRETQESFTDSLSNTIDEQTISLGELRFGPILSKTMKLADGSIFTPKIGLSGVWNFGIENTNTSQASLLNNDDLRARIDAGISFKSSETGTALQLEGFYDGFGVRDYDAFGGSLKIVVPLN